MNEKCDHNALAAHLLTTTRETLFECGHQPLHPVLARPVHCVAFVGSAAIVQLLSVILCGAPWTISGNWGPDHAIGTALSTRPLSEP